MTAVSAQHVAFTSRFYEEDFSSFLYYNYNIVFAYCQVPALRTKRNSVSSGKSKLIASVE